MILTLFSTDGCHLCHQAQALYCELSLKTPLIVQDIAFDDTLFARYGVSIPVLSVQTLDEQLVQELFWPFDSIQLKTWLNKHGIN